MDRKTEPVKLIKKNEDLLEKALVRETEQSQSATDDNTIKIVFATSGEYPDGTSWERDATEEEEAEYKSWTV